MVRPLDKLGTAQAHHTMQTADQKLTYEELLETNAALQQSNAALQIEVFRLKEQLALFQRLLFGQKRERFVPGDDRQLELGLNIEKQSPPQPETEKLHYTRRKRSKVQTPPVRQPLPSHLPRKDIIIEPQEDVSGMKRIGEEISEELEYEPGKFYVNRYIRPKYARPNEEGVVIGQLPSRPIEKGIPGPGLLSHILISKFVDHLPLYRQQKQFKRSGVDISDSTLVGWVKAGYELLLPLYAEWMLTAIQQLYAIERQAREEAMSYQERYLLRQQDSQPILNTIKAWLDEECLQVLPKSLMGKAIGYMLNQWPKLQNYLLDGRLEIDNNLVENAIRPVALGRKNYLFAGSHEGAKRAALVYSLVATAKLHEVEPFEYLRDIISRISDYPYQQIGDLLPANWKIKFKK